MTGNGTFCRLKQILGHKNFAATMIAHKKSVDQGKTAHPAYFSAKKNKIPHQGGIMGIAPSDKRMAPDS